MSTNDLYHNCQWCKYFDRETQTCVNERAFELDDDFDFSPFTEEGHLAEAIKEGFSGFKFTELKQALFKSSLSKKKQAEILKVFESELETAQMNWTESIDGAVSVALKNFDFDLGGVSIVDPSEFHCKHFW